MKADRIGGSGLTDPPAPKEKPRWECKNPACARHSTPKKPVPQYAGLCSGCIRPNAGISAETLEALKSQNRENPNV